MPYAHVSYPLLIMDANLAEIKVLFPTLTDEELVIAQENIDRYLLIAWKIYESTQEESTGLDRHF